MDDIDRAGGRTLDDEGIPDLDGPLPEKTITGDPQEGAAPPADRPASLDHGTTAAEQRAGETLDERIAREQPDVDERDIVERDADPDVLGDVPEPVQLVGPEDQGAGVADVEKDEVARAVDPGPGGVPAEEAALRIEPE